MSAYNTEEIVNVAYRYIKDHPGCRSSDIYNHFIDDLNNKTFPTKGRISSILKIRYEVFRNVKEQKKDLKWYIVEDKK